MQLLFSVDWNFDRDAFDKSDICYAYLFNKYRRPIMDHEISEQPFWGGVGGEETQS